MTERRRARWAVRRAVTIGAVGLLAGMAASCSLDSLLKSNEVPNNITDPALTKTPQGALQVYQGTLRYFQPVFAASGGTYSAFVPITGLLSDELQPGGSPPFGGGFSTVPDVFDARLDTTGSAIYKSLQQLRGQAQQAIGLLTDYAPPEQRPLIGHVYALEGYAEVMLAELYCSGIPLSTVDYNGDFTLKPGSTTADVFAHAVALFDTALAFAGDSARFVQMAAVGKGRALLGFGQFAAAAEAVVAVPDLFAYQVLYGGTGSDSVRNFAGNFETSSGSGHWQYSVSNQEGSNGLDYISSEDPRTATDSTGLHTGASQYGYRIHVPLKYPSGTSPVVLASGIEARLIEAEAQLQVGSGDWLATLNALRTDGTFTVNTRIVAIDNTVTPPDTTFAYDTLWHAGSGGYGGLPPLDDPGTVSGRVDLLFHERAFWLFLAGHREGDLRRLIRQYGRMPEDIYPVGPYPSGLGVTYGDKVYLPVPSEEQALNPLYGGCFQTPA